MKFANDKRGIFSAVLHWVSFGLMLWLGIRVALFFRPEPTMDSKLYWELAYDLSIYHKGGLIGLWLLPLRWIGLEPYVAALVMNGLCLFGLYYATWFNGLIDSTKRFALQLLLTVGATMFGFWFSGYLGIINADFTNVALIIMAMRSFHDYLIKNEKKHLIMGLLAMFFAISFRVKTGLALGGLIVYMALFGYKRLKKQKVVRLFVISLAVMLVFAAGVEIVLRVQSEAKIDVARQGRLQLYTGLLDTSVGPMCGRWTREAYDKTLEELDLSLVEVFQKHLGVKSKAYLFEIIKCKLNAIVQYTDFSYREIIPVGVQYRPVTSEDYSVIRKYEAIEHDLVVWFKWLVYFMMMMALILGFKDKMVGKTLPLVIYGGFLALHAVFEIQARYMVEPLMWAYFVGIFVISYHDFKHDRD
ncbi:MAG TPA: hypothetical protein DCS67_08520 [Clostridiales bacterium UBA8960]|nr:hypothetical protein [Clostridiales bacterium UBA8960]